MDNKIILANPGRRTIIAGSTALVIFSALPQPASAAWSEAIGAVFTSVGEALSKWFQALTSKKSDATAEARTWYYARVTHLIDNLPISERLAVLSNGAFVNAVNLGSIDKIGSSLELIKGHLELSRGQYGGQLTADEAKDNATHIVPADGAAAVPVEHYQKVLDSRDMTKRRDEIGKFTGLNPDDYAIHAERRVSTARDVTRDGANYRMLLAVNKKKRIDNGMPQIDTIMLPVQTKT